MILLVSALVRNFSCETPSEYSATVRPMSLTLAMKN